MLILESLQVFGTFATVEHPEWDGSFGNGFDIALILLTGSSTGETVTLGPVSEGQEVATLGWGRVAGAGVFPLVLQEAREMEVTVQQCIEIYKVSSFTAVLIMSAATIRIPLGALETGQKRTVYVQKCQRPC